MNLGFNSNVRVGENVYHVQTEDRGPGHPYIDTTVYFQGRVLHRRLTSYHDLLASDGATEAVLKERVEKQHREVIEELRTGVLQFAAAHAGPAAAATPGSMPARHGLQARLLNTGSWLAAGIATLKIEVLLRGSQQPAADVGVEVTLEGAPGTAHFAGRTDAHGCAELSFPLPRVGPDGATLVIRAAGEPGEDTIRFQLRPRAKTPAPQTPAT